MVLHFGTRLRVLHPDRRQDILYVCRLEGLAHVLRVNSLLWGWRVEGGLYGLTSLTRLDDVVSEHSGRSYTVSGRGYRSWRRHRRHNAVK